MTEIADELSELRTENERLKLQNARLLTGIKRAATAIRDFVDDQQIRNYILSYLVKLMDGRCVEVLSDALEPVENP